MSQMNRMEQLKQRVVQWLAGLQSRMNRALGVAALVPALVILLAVNLLGAALGGAGRLDLTEGGLYTLSRGTRNILASLEEPVELRFFLSREHARSRPGINAYANRVSGLLREYERRAGGNLRLQEIDPEPFSEEEDRAVAYGLRGVRVGQKGEVLYFGLAGESSTGETEVISFFSQSREQYLEYDLSRLVHRLSYTESSVETVGILSTLPVRGGADANGQAQSPWTSISQADENFVLRDLPRDVKKIDSDVDVLLLVQPLGLSDATLYAIEQFVLGGGRLLVFVDSLAETEATPAPEDEPQPERTFNELLTAWGVQLVPDKVAADLERALRVRAERDGRSELVYYPIYFSVGPSEVDRRDVVTAKLNKLTFATPGHFEAVEDALTDFSVLAATTAGAAEYDSAQARPGVSPRSLLRNYEKMERPLTLAARISGPAESVFESRPKGARGSRLEESEGDINIIVVSDTDFLQDRLWVRVNRNILVNGKPMTNTFSDNGLFVMNALENLAGSGDLISVRRGEAYQRPLTLVQSIRSDAELRNQKKTEELNKALAEARQKLRNLESQRSDENQLLVDEKREREIARYRRERVRIRKELRAVNYDSRRDIENLENFVVFANTGLAPLLMGGAAIAFSALRRRRIRRLLAGRQG